MNICFSILTQSDLNRQWEGKPSKKRLVQLMGEFTRVHVAVNRWCGKVRSLQYFQTWQIIVSIFFKLSLNDWKENVKIVKKSPLPEKKQRALCTHHEWVRSFVASSNCCQQQLWSRWACLPAVFFAMLTCWHVQVSKIFAFAFFSAKINFYL